MTSPFYLGTNFQFAWNSSSLGTLKECPRKYFYQYIEGWTPKGDGLHFRFGALYHWGLEHYEVLLTQGLSPEDALDEVVNDLLLKTWDGREADGIGHPWDTSSFGVAGSKKNRQTLIRSVIWYIDHYNPDPAQTIILDTGKPALELTFTMEIDALTPRGEPYLFTGHLDRLVDYGGDKFVVDRKTSGSTLGSYYFEKFSPDNQMSLYPLVSRVVFDVPVSGVILDAAQIAVGFTSFGRGMTLRSEGQLTEWLHDAVLWLRNAEQFAEASHWPMNDTSCHKYDGCEFRKICNKDPQVRHMFLETDFVRTTHNADRILEGSDAE